MTELTIEQEYSVALSASVNNKRRAEAAEARAEQRLEEIIGLKRELAAAELHVKNASDMIRKLEAERDEARRKLELMQDWIASLDYIGIDSSDRSDYRSKTKRPL